LRISGTMAQAKYAPAAIKGSSGGSGSSSGTQTSNNPSIVINNYSASQTGTNPKIDVVATQPLNAAPPSN
jgi:hypothetical protein